MKNTILFFAVVSLVFFASCKSNPSPKKQLSKQDTEEGNIPLKDRMDLAWAQEKEMTKDLTWLRTH